MAPKVECIDALKLNTLYADLLSQAPYVEAKSPHYLHQYLTRRQSLMFICMILSTIFFFLVSTLIQNVCLLFQCTVILYNWFCGVPPPEYLGSG